jgi:hypothetical protein
MWTALILYAARVHINVIISEISGGLGSWSQQVTRVHQITDWMSKFRSLTPKKFIFLQLTQELRQHQLFCTDIKKDRKKLQTEVLAATARKSFLKISSVDRKPEVVVCEPSVRQRAAMHRRSPLLCTDRTGLLRPQHDWAQCYSLDLSKLWSSLQPHRIPESCSIFEPLPYGPINHAWNLAKAARPRGKN